MTRSMRWWPDNRIALLENGEQYFPRVFEAIAAAEHEVLLETFILFDDQVGRGLQQALLQAPRRGAAVHVLVDGWGSPDLPASFLAPLLDAGVQVRSFEPVQRLFGNRINLLRRMHRKLVVVDGRTAFVGGINYSVDHLVDVGPLSKQDYAVEVEGPLVAQIQAFCRANLDLPATQRGLWWQGWRRRRAARAEDRENERAVDRHEHALAAFYTRDNHGHRNDIEQAYRAALRGSRQRVLIANAYFFPGYRLVRDLRRAARRGVQVDLILQGRPDQPWVQHASRLLYGYLLRAGVRIHEYGTRPLHAKVAVVDDRWATVGSSNLDPTSLGLNLEANVVVRDPVFARHLRQRLDGLLQDDCVRVHQPTPGRFDAAWIALRTWLVFHFMRRYPAWAAGWRWQRPKVAAVQLVDS